MSTSIRGWWNPSAHGQNLPWHEDLSSVMAAKPGATPLPGGQYEVARSLSPMRMFALKHDDTFIAADEFGDIVGDRDGTRPDGPRCLSDALTRIAEAGP